MPEFIKGAEKAAVAAAVGFVTGSALGYLDTHDWRGFLYGLGVAVLTGVSTYATKNTPTVAK